MADAAALNALREELRGAMMDQQRTHKEQLAEVESKLERVTMQNQDLRQQLEESRAGVSANSPAAGGQRASPSADQQGAGGGASADTSRVDGETHRSGGTAVQNSVTRDVVYARYPQRQLGDTLKFPVGGRLAQQVEWMSRLEVHLKGEGLVSAISKDAPLIPINTDESDGSLHAYDRAVVADHHRLFGILLEATSRAPFASRILSCSSAPEAWRMLAGCVIPQSPDEIYLLKQEVENVRYDGDEAPDLFLSRLDGLLKTLSRAGVSMTDEDVSRIIVRQLGAPAEISCRACGSFPRSCGEEQSTRSRGGYGERVSLGGLRWWYGLQRHGPGTVVAATAAVEQRCVFAAAATAAVERWWIVAAAVERWWIAAAAAVERWWIIPAAAMERW